MMAPSIMPTNDKARPGVTRDCLPTCLSICHEKIFITKPPKNPSGNRGTLFILNHKKETRNAITIQPYVCVLILWAGTEAWVWG